MGWDDVSIPKLQRYAWSHIKRCTRLSQGRISTTSAISVSKKQITVYFYVSPKQMSSQYCIVPEIWQVLYV